MKSRRLISRSAADALDLSSRIRVEREITDSKANLFHPAAAPASWELDAYASHSPWRRHMFDFLGPVRGKVVLDLGCGYHPTPLYLAAAGAARVYACDISPKAVAHIKRVAAERGFSDRIVPVVCAAEQLPFPDEQVDLVHGEAVLHHLALPVAARDIARILKSGGRAAFKDPLGQNPVLELARDYMKHSAKATDRPMRFGQLEEFGRCFARSSYRGFGLLAMAVAAVGRSRSRPLARALDSADRWLLARFPGLERFCQYVVTCTTK